MDDGNIVALLLSPANSWEYRTTKEANELEKTTPKPVFLFRHRRSTSGEEDIAKDIFAIERDLIPFKFERTPEFRVIWSDSGHSIALYLNGDPWAFIDEETLKGFSKGILKPEHPRHRPLGNLWDQKLFEKIFGV